MIHDLGQTELVVYAIMLLIMLIWLVYLVMGSWYILLHLIDQGPWHDRFARWAGI